MERQMPRGAMPTPRSELAAAPRYQPESGQEAFVPSGEFPTSNQELVAAKPFKAAGVAPESFLLWPKDMSYSSAEESTSLWQEEVFAKACAEPKVSIPGDVVRRTAKACGSSNFARFMQAQGFELDGKAYLDGPFESVDWTDSNLLHAAIAQAGPVKVGIALASLSSAPGGKVTRDKSGWALYGAPKAQPGDYCASLCGYGALNTLLLLFAAEGVTVHVPSGMPPGVCYALFASGSIGIVDQDSLMNIVGEAWVRNPTTVVKDLRG